tara:strand:+ start:849 stop:1022 length:174 start_codon:yes stop_codon:yes gene_type:complete
MNIYKGKRHWYLKTDSFQKKFPSEEAAIAYAEENNLVEKEELLVEPFEWSSKGSEEE